MSAGYGSRADIRKRRLDDAEQHRINREKTRREAEAEARVAELEREAVRLRSQVRLWRDRASEKAEANAGKYRHYWLDTTSELDAAEEREKALRAQLLGLAEWHETKAEKARRFRPEVDGENPVMDKAAEVHDDAARRAHALLNEGVSDE